MSSTPALAAAIGCRCTIPPPSRGIAARPPVELRRFLAGLSWRGGGKGRSSDHRWLARQEEHDILRHQAEDRFAVPRLRRRDPGSDELTDLLLIILHAGSSPASTSAVTP